MATVAPFPLLPPISTELRLAHFDEQVYTATPDTLLYKFVDAICGTTGAGSLLNQSFMTRLTNALETIYFNDLDYIFSKINFLGRSPAESYPYNPMTDMLTSAQWDEVRVKDAWYRARIKDFFAACSLGGTPMGIRMCVQAAVGTDCTLLETWRYVDCADEETEILTRSGYKKYSDLRVGEEVLTLNMASGLAEWQPNSKVNIFPVADCDMLSVEVGGRHSSLTTMNHRWPVHSRARRTDGSRKYSDIRVRTSSELKTEDRLIRAAPLTGLPEVAKFTDPLVELVAWFVTEGHIHNQTSIVTIVQSHTVNPNKVDDIRAALTALIGPAVESFDRTGPRDGQRPAWREWVSSSKPDITVFRLNSAAGRLLIEHAPDKVTSMSFINSLTQSQLHLFMNTCIAADGHIRKDGYRSFIQKSMDRITPVQIVATLLGISTSIHQQQGDCHVLSLCERQKFVQPLGQGRKNAQIIQYTGTVWCPTTPNGTWFARRRGTTYFTGNSFGLGDNLGRSAVSARNEITVRPRKDELSPEEFRLLRDMLDRISPMETIVTINLKGLSMLAPVKISSINASSTYFEVQKSVTASPVIKTMTATDLNLQDTLNESEQWLFDAIDDPKDAPYSAFNITSECAYYYLIGGGERSPIDSVSYGILQPDGSVRPESNFEVFRSSGAYTDWVNYEKADSPDNFPGGKYGISPMKAPALNPDRTPYQFPWPSQAAYVEDKKLKVQASGGIADDFHYKLPIKEGSSPKTTYWPEYAVAYTAPAQESSVSMNFTANRGNTLAGDWVDPATFVST